MKVLSIRILDFAGIVEADLHPGKLMVLAGANAQGKTSILKAVRAALEGADPVAIRQGTERAEILVDLEEIKVHRTITAGKQQVEVTDAKGWKLPKAPQTYLSSLLGTVQFNPMEFLRSKPAQRRQMLLEAVSKQVTFDEIVEITGEVVPGLPKEGPALDMYGIAGKYFYDARTAVNKDAARLKTLHFEEMKRLPGDFVPDPEIDVKLSAVRDGIQIKGKTIAGLEAEKKAAEKAKERRVTLETTRREHGAFIDQVTREIKEATEGRPQPIDAEIIEQEKVVAALRTQLEDAETQLKSLTLFKYNLEEKYNEIGQAVEAIDEINKNLAALPGEFDESRLEAARKESADLEIAQTALLSLQQTMKVHASVVSLEADRKEIDARAEVLTGLVGKFREELPGKVLAEANLPIEGLRIEGDDITVRNLPLDSLSGRERMEFALSIVRALAAGNPLKLICIDGIEQLDAESFKAFEAQAKKDEFQYFVTRVGTPREGEVEVKAGKVVAG